MLTRNELETWLEQANERYRIEHLPPKQRPIQALSDLSIHLKCSITLGSELANQVVDWFRRNTQPGSHAIGSLFESAYYFDACFWHLSIPIGFGTFRFDVFNSLESMPVQIKQRLANNEKETEDLVSHWADCCDYAYGLDDILQIKQLSEYSLSLLGGAKSELSAGIAQVLTQPHPNMRAILSFRMATEIFFKAYLVQEKNLNENELKSINHSLYKAIEESCKINPNPSLAFVMANLHVFPPVSARYEPNSFSLAQVWLGLKIAQISGAFVARCYSNRNVKAQILHS